MGCSRQLSADNYIRPFIRHRQSAHLSCQITLAEPGRACGLQFARSFGHRIMRRKWPTKEKVDGFSESDSEAGLPSLSVIYFGLGKFLPPTALKVKSWAEAPPSPRQP